MITVECSDSVKFHVFTCITEYKVLGVEVLLPYFNVISQVSLTNELFPFKRIFVYCHCILNLLYLIQSEHVFILKDSIKC